MENTNEKTKTEAHAETPAAEEKKPQTDSHSRAFAFILTAVIVSLVSFNNWITAISFLMPNPNV